MQFDILSLFPEMFPGVLGASIFSRAAKAGHVTVRLHNIRHYATDKHRTTDDYPFGGGAGMVMKPEPLFRAVEWVYRLPEAPAGITQYDPPPEALLAEPVPLPGAPDVPVVLMTPQGKLLTHAMAAELARHPRILIVCGHYEGVDDRVREHLVTHEVSIGDYVLTGGELAAMVLCDAVARLVPGVLSEGSAEDESHVKGLLEHPQYTRPAVFRGWGVPSVLVSGHHGEVEKWRRREAILRTLARRRDLLEQADLTPAERKWLQGLRDETGEESGQS